MGKIFRPHTIYKINQHGKYAFVSIQDLSSTNKGKITYNIPWDEFTKTDAALFGYFSCTAT